MFTLNESHHTGNQVLQKLSLVLWLALGGMGFTQNAMSQDQAANAGTESRAANQSPSSVSGQSGTTDSAATILLSPEELEDLVARMALYPDDLVGIILPASTFPLQVVQAVRYLKLHEEDPDLQVNEEWDDSIVALLNYPEVLQMMDADLDWTWELGATVLNQEAEVMNSIQRFRQRAIAAGNLVSDDKQTVSNAGGVIEIRSVDPKVIYIPSYEPDEVIVYQPRPVYRYYPVAYPVYYYPYEPDYRFRARSFWGLQSAFYVGWDMHCINVFPYDYYRHPYYGSTFYFDFYWDNYRQPYSYRNRYTSTNVYGYDQGGAVDYRWRTDRADGAWRLFNHDTQRRQRSGSYNRRWTDNQLQQGINTVPEQRQMPGIQTMDRNNRTAVNRTWQDHRQSTRTPRETLSNDRVPFQSGSRYRQGSEDQIRERGWRTDRAAIPEQFRDNATGTGRFATNRSLRTRPRSRSDQSAGTQDSTVRTLSRANPIDSAPRMEEADRWRANQSAMTESSSQFVPDAGTQNRVPSQDAGNPSRSRRTDNGRRHLR